MVRWEWTCNILGELPSNKLYYIAGACSLFRCNAPPPPPLAWLLKQRVRAPRSIGPASFRSTRKRHHRRGRRKVEICHAMIARRLASAPGVTRHPATAANIGQQKYLPSPPACRQRRTELAGCSQVEVGQTASKFRRSFSASRPQRAYRRRCS